MPRVPTYDGPQVQSAVSPSAYQADIDVTRGQRALASGLGQASDALGRIQERSDQDSAFATEAKIKTDWLTYESQLRENRKGRDAATYDADVDQWWKDAAQTYAKDLTPGARRLISRSLTTSQVQAVAGAKAYKEQQLNASADASYKSAQTLSVNEASTIGTEDAAIKAEADMAQKRADRARLMGWTPEQTKADEISWNSSLYATVVQKQMRADPAAAQAIYDRNKSKIGADQQAQLEAGLQQTSAALDAGNAATEIWGSIGPKAYGQPVDLAAMEDAARERFKGDPTRQKGAIAEIRQRAEAFNASEREVQAAGVNSVYRMLDSGTPMSRVRASAEWQSIPGQEQDRILAQMESRAATRANRAASESARNLSELQRRDKLSVLQNADQYLEYSDPDRLGAMTRDQVRALRPTFGLEGTEQLLNRWDSLQKSGAKVEARIDAEDFNHIADTMGLSPYRANTEDKKRSLGELKFKVEQLIDQAQQNKKAPLTRDEKMALMQTEIARTVTVNPTFGFRRDVPVIQLSKDDLKDVEVPEVDRKQIADALKVMYDRTKSPIYSPTEDNMRRLYLLNKSKAGALLPQGR